MGRGPMGSGVMFSPEKSVEVLPAALSELWSFSVETIRQLDYRQVESEQSRLGMRLLGVLPAAPAGALRLEAELCAGANRGPRLRFALLGPASGHLGRAAFDVGRWFGDAIEEAGGASEEPGEVLMDVIPAQVRHVRSAGFLPTEARLQTAVGHDVVVDWHSVITALDQMEYRLRLIIRYSLATDHQALTNDDVADRVRCTASVLGDASATREVKLVLSSAFAPAFRVQESTTGQTAAWDLPINQAAFFVPYPLPRGADGGLFPVSRWEPVHLRREALQHAASEVAVELGVADTRHEPRIVGLTSADFARHVHVMGQTGVGKSTLLAHMVRSEAQRGAGLCVLDPHGPLVDEIRATLPRSARRRLVVLDVGNDEPPKLNVLNARGIDNQSVAIQDLGEMFYDLFDPGRTGIVGPRFEAWLRIGLLTLLEARGRRASILDVPRLFTDIDFLRGLFKEKGFKHPLVYEFWTKEMAQTSDYHRSEMLGWFAAKFERFRSNPTMVRVLGSGDDSLDFASAMDRRRIILIRLSAPEIGDVNARLLGYLYLSRIWTGALSRKAREVPFSLYVDEYQSFTVSVLPRALAEGRKFGLRIIAAHQYLEQLRADAHEALSATVGNRIFFRGRPDGLTGTTARHFSSALERMPNFRALACLLDGGVPIDPFTLSVPPPPPAITQGAKRAGSGEGSRKTGSVRAK